VTATNFREIVTATNFGERRGDRRISQRRACMNRAGYRGMKQLVAVTNSGLR